MKIVKQLIACGLFIVSLSLVSCGTTKKAGKGKKNKVDAEAPETEEVAEAEGTEEGGESSDVIDAEGEVAEGEEGEAAEGSEGEDKKNRNYTGWIDIPSKDIDLKSGSIRLRTKTKIGSYNISVQSENGKYLPVLSTANEYTSSYYSLKADRKIYKLITDGNTKTRAKKDDSGVVSMYYFVKDVAEVKVDYKIFSSVEGKDPDMIKITATVTNRGTKKSEFALKAILDTVLGESTQNHFYTSENIPIKSEAMYRTMQNEKWFMSRNNSVKMQILLDGADITKIDSVSLANYATLDIKSWEPDMLSYRAFDTVLSYNNSAVGIIWPSAKLAVDESFTCSYYLAFATDIDMPKGAEYIASLSPQNTEAVQNELISNLMSEAVVEKAVEAPLVVPASTAAQMVPPTPVPAPAPAVISAAQSAGPEVIKEIPSVQFDVSKLSKEQLSPEYIQNLLDRIAALEEDDNNLNREELLSLNAELDAILEVLRQ